MSPMRVTLPHLGQGDIAAGAVASGQIHAQQISLAGIVTDSLEQHQGLEVIVGAARSQSDEVLDVVSANLDHVHPLARNQHLQVRREVSSS
jgi:hypothetical protein